MEDAQTAAYNILLLIKKTSFEDLVTSTLIASEFENSEIINDIHAIQKKEQLLQKLPPDVSKCLRKIDYQEMNIIAEYKRKLLEVGKENNGDMGRESFVKELIARLPVDISLLSDALAKLTILIRIFEDCSHYNDAINKLIRFRLDKLLEAIISKKRLLTGVSQKKLINNLKRDEEINNLRSQYDYVALTTELHQLQQNMLMHGIDVETKQRQNELLEQMKNIDATINISIIINKYFKENQEIENADIFAEEKIQQDILEGMRNIEIQKFYQLLRAVDDCKRELEKKLIAKLEEQNLDLAAQARLYKPIYTDLNIPNKATTKIGTIWLEDLNEDKEIKVVDDESKTFGAEAQAIISKTGEGRILLSQYKALSVLQKTLPEEVNKLNYMMEFKNSNELKTAFKNNLQNLSFEVSNSALINFKTKFEESKQTFSQTSFGEKFVKIVLSIVSLGTAIPWLWMWRKPPGGALVENVELMLNKSKEASESIIDTIKRRIFSH